MEDGPAGATWSAAARRTGIVVALSLFALVASYAVILILGLKARPDATAPIPDPWFTAMEILILAIAPLLILLIAAIRSLAPPDRLMQASAALCFMSATSILTITVHSMILSFGSDAAVAHPELLAFVWPSVVYVLDVLAWDGFFALAVLFAAFALPPAKPASYARWLLVGSGIVSMTGLLGAIAGDMDLRNIGIIGYAGFFPAAAVALALLFARTSPASGRAG